MKNKSLFHVFTNGLLNENPTFRLLLGMCPTLAISTAGPPGNIVVPSYTKTRKKQVDTARARGAW